MHGFQRINSPSDMAHPPTKTTVQVSVLFNSKQDATHLSNQPSKKQAILPNLTVRQTGNQSAQGSKAPSSMFTSAANSLSGTLHVPQQTVRPVGNTAANAPNSAQLPASSKAADINVNQGPQASSPGQHPSNTNFILRKASHLQKAPVSLPEERDRSRERESGAKLTSVPITLKCFGGGSKTVTKNSSFGQLPKINTDQKRIIHGQTTHGGSASQSNLKGRDLALAQDEKTVPV